MFINFSTKIGAGGKRSKLSSWFALNERSEEAQ